MKNLSFIIILLVFNSCSTYHKNEQKQINELTVKEKAIINDFLDAELNKEQYYRFTNYKLIVNEEALKKIKSLETYLYSLDEFNTMNKIKKNEDVNKIYFLNSTQIKTIKNKLENEENYHWKVTDFKNIKIRLLKHEELIKTTNTGEYLTKHLILYLSRPILIDENNALLSFDIGHGDLGFYPITHFTVLMRKSDNKWVENGYYEDGVF